MKIASSAGIILEDLSQTQSQSMLRSCQLDSDCMCQSMESNCGVTPKEPIQLRHESTPDLVAGPPC